MGGVAARPLSIGASDDFESAMQESSISSKDIENNRQRQSDSEVGLEPTDAVLLKAISAGESEAFWNLWDRHQKRLRQLCLRLMDGHASDAEDALSLVMLKARDRLPASAGKVTHLEAWLQMLAKNLCLDLRRERQRRIEMGESWKHATLEETTSSQPVLQGEGEGEIQQQIAALPTPLREPFMLNIVLEIPVKEVGAQLGLTPANVRKRVQMARAALRHTINRRHLENADLPPAEKQTPTATSASRDQRHSSKTVEPFPTASFVRTVRVTLSCGVEHLFHVFPTGVPHSYGRKIKLLEDDVSQNPDNWKKRLALADLAYFTGNWNKAVAQWQQVLLAQPHLPPVLKLVETLFKLGRIEVATEVLNNIPRQDFKSAATGRDLAGWLALCQNDTGEAVRNFEAAATIEPENPVHWQSLVLAHRLNGEIACGLRVIQQALELNPNDLAALSLGHEMLLADHAVEEAMRRAQLLLTIAPDDLLSLQRLVECRCHLHLIQGAAGRETVRLLRRAMRLAHHSFAVHELLATYFLAQGNPKKALVTHRQFSEAHPQCQHGRQHYSQLLAATGLSQRLPLELDVWKTPPTKHCPGICHHHEPAGFLHAGPKS